MKTKLKIEAEIHPDGTVWLECAGQDGVLHALGSDLDDALDNLFCMIHADNQSHRMKRYPDPFSDESLADMFKRHLTEHGVTELNFDVLTEREQDALLRPVRQYQQQVKAEQNLENLFQRLTKVEPDIGKKLADAVSSLKPELQSD